jgi:hypothetical protein
MCNKSKQRNSGEGEMGRRGRVHIVVGFTTNYAISLYFQQHFNYIVAVSFIGGENRSTRGKPLTCRSRLYLLVFSKLFNQYVFIY